MLKDGDKIKTIVSTEAMPLFAKKPEIYEEEEWFL